MVRRHLREKTFRRTVIKHGIHPSVKEKVRIVHAGKRHHAAEQIRAAQECDQCVVGPHTKTGDSRRLVVAFAHEGNDFLNNIVKVLLLTGGAPLFVTLTQ